MANEQNLRPGEYKFTQEDAKKGQKNSAITRARKAAMKKPMSAFAKMIAKAPVEDKDAIEALRAAGIDDDHMINAALVVFGVYRAAIMGDMKAVDKWQQLTEGTAPTPENTVKIVMTGPIQELSE